MSEISVLVIEDEAELLEEVSDMLRFEGYEVLTAKSGEEGLELARKNEPDLILCDIVMPGISGFDVLNELKTENGAGLVPFIFITARTERVNLRLGMDMGADDYIIKPFTRQELINSVNARLKKMKAVRKSVNSLKEEVVVSFPHEFRTPLNAILGFSKIIHEDIGNYSTHEIADIAGHIFNSGKDLLRLTQKYLTYVDIISHPREFFFDRAENVSGIIREIAEEVAVNHHREGDLSLTLSNCVLNVTDDLFRFALHELIDNAFKFSEGGSMVEVKTDIDLLNYQIIINDHGIGFPDGSIEKISAFKQFPAGNFSRSGVGLGLFLAMQIIEINKGHLKIFSVPGHGTKISILLPVATKSRTSNAGLHLCEIHGE
ncbi:MAG: hybrid sensor histidine kinase/response regulator [Marinilabiliaceae bacterium]